MPATAQATPTLVECESVGELGSFIKQCMLSSDLVQYEVSGRR